MEDFCRRCESKAELKQFPMREPMQRVGVDIMGPFPRTTQDNLFVLTAMDFFTKWPGAFAVPALETEMDANALVEGMFSRFGAPQNIHTVKGEILNPGYSPGCESDWES